MLEIKITLSLDEKTHEVLDKLASALAKELTIKVDEPKKKVDKPPKTVVAPQDKTVEIIEEVVDKEKEPNIKPKEPTSDKYTIQTIEDLRLIMVGVKRKHGSDVVKALLTAEGVTSLSGL